MRRNLITILLGLSLVGNVALAVALARARGGTPAAPMAAAQATTDEVPPTVPPTPTTQPTRPPAVTQMRPSATPLAPAPSPQPTATPTDEPEPTAPPSPTPVPDTPAPEPSPTIEAVGTDWLQYLNYFRAMAGAPPVVENSLWSLDAADHSRYMVYTGELRHDQTVGSPYFSRAGQAAAQNSNIAAGYTGSTPFQWAFNYWASAPFHAVPMLDPELSATGFSEYRDGSGAQPVAATLDVRRGLGALPDGVTYPLMFPGDGQTTWVLRYSLPEFPQALSHCAGYQQDTGAPIILQLGDGRLTPQVSASSLARDGQYLAHCLFDETNYTHPDPYIQRSARTILDQRDAVVLIPQAPLLPDSTYQVRIDANGQTYTWSFRTATGPP